MARRDALPFETEFLQSAPARPIRPLIGVLRPNVAQLRFALPRTTTATVGVYAPNGSLVRRVLSGELAAGEHACGWDGCDERDVPVGTGIYLFRLEVDGRVVASRRVVIG